MASSIKNGCNKSSEAVGCQVIIRPFESAGKLSCQDSAANVKTSVRLSIQQDKDDSTDLVIIARKKPQIIRPYKPPHKTKWSKEVQKVPTLHTLTKDRTSLQCTNLGYEASHWCFSSLDDEVDGPFKGPESDGINISQQSQGGFDMIRTRTSQENRITDSKKEFSQDGLPASVEKESHLQPVSLSFDEELERKDVKVLTLRVASVYKAWPIVSETFPVLYKATQHQHETFRSPGLHILTSSEQNPSCKQSHVNSAIIHRSQSVQMMDISSPRKKTSITLTRVPITPGLKRSKSGGAGRRAQMCVLSADGAVVRFPAMGQPFLNEDYTTSDLTGVSSPTYKISPKSLVTPKRKHFPTSVGLVIHGKKASTMFDPGRMLPGYSKPAKGTQRRGLNISEPTTTLQKQRITGTVHDTRTDSLFISKLVKNNQNYPGSLMANKQMKRNEEPDQTKNIIKNVDSDVTGVNGMNLSRFSTADVTHKREKENEPISEYFHLSGRTMNPSENNLRSDSSLQPQRIFIPTA